MSFEDPTGADQRHVQSRTHNGRETRVVAISRDYSTTPDDLWQAITNPERLARWFLPVSGDLKPGGRYQLKGHAGGVIETCAPPDALQLTWEVGANISWVGVTLVAAGDSTTLNLEHTMLKDAESEEHWAKYGPGATGVGWELGLLALGIHLTTNGRLIDPNEYETWSVSAAGKTFVRHCATAWGEAHIASGTDSRKARAMATRTGAFYAGE